MASFQLLFIPLYLDFVFFCSCNNAKQGSSGYDPHLTLLLYYELILYDLQWKHINLTE